LSGAVVHIWSRTDLSCKRSISLPGCGGRTGRARAAFWPSTRRSFSTATRDSSSVRANSLRARVSSPTAVRTASASAGPCSMPARFFHSEGAVGGQLSSQMTSATLSWLNMWFLVRKAYTYVAKWPSPFRFLTCCQQPTDTMACPTEMNQRRYNPLLKDAVFCVKYTTWKRATIVS
jgi:hypothetical protein